MAALRQPQPELDPPERPSLRLVAPFEGVDADAAREAALAQAAFNNGLRWGIVVASLGFWLPTAAALYTWLT